jgi:hypothetical protein
LISIDTENKCQLNFNIYTGLNSLKFSELYHHISTLFHFYFNLFQIKPCNVRDKIISIISSYFNIISTLFQLSLGMARLGRRCVLLTASWHRGACCGPPLALAARRERGRFAIQFCIQIAPARRARLSRRARRSSDSRESRGAERRWQRAEPFKLSVAGAAVEDPVLQKAVAVAHYNTR